MSQADREYKRDIKAFERVNEEIGAAYAKEIIHPGGFVATPGYDGLNGIRIGAKLTAKQAEELEQQLTVAL